MLNRSITPWWSVFAGACACAVGAGIFAVYTWGIFSKAISTEFGWDRATLSLCLTCFLIATGFGTITLGQAIARYGVRVATLAYVAVFSLSLAVITVLPPLPWAYYAVFAVMGFAGSAATALPYAVAITGWFDRHRGLALGLMVFGSGFGAMLAPHFVTRLIGEFGWRASLLVVAVITALVPMIGVVCCVREPPMAKTTAARSRGLWRSYILRRHFWLIALPIIGVSVATFGLLGSMVSILTDRGATGAMAATVLSLAGIGSWIGRLAVGYAMDRMFAPYLTAGVLCLVLLGVFFVAWGNVGPWVVAGAVLLGLGMGSEADIVAYLVGRYFPYDIYSRVLGAMWVAWAWGGGIGTFLSSLTFRWTHSYGTALALFVALLLASVVIITRLGPYLFPPERHTPFPHGARLPTAR